MIKYRIVVGPGVYTIEQKRGLFSKWTFVCDVRPPIDTQYIRDDSHKAFVEAANNALATVESLRKADRAVRQGIVIGGSHG